MQVRRALFGSAAVAMVLAGCGGAGDSSDTPGTVENAVTMHVSSPEFRNWTKIPPTYTCFGEGNSPPLSWSDAPPRTRSISVLVADPDAWQQTYVHWLLINLQPRTSGLDSEEPGETTGPAGSVQGTNSGGSRGYTPACPPSGRTHHNQFTVYALDKVLPLQAGATRSDLLEAMAGHIIGRGQLVGLVKAY